MKLKQFFIALVAMVACFSEAFAQQVITVSNAEELKQALEGSLAPSTKRMAAAAATEATYPGSTYALGADVTDENIAYLMDSPMFNPLILDLNGFMVTGDLTIKNGQLSIIDSKGTGAWIGCITVDSGATLAAGSGSIIAGESGVAVINNGTLSTDGGAVIGKITNNGDMPGVATYNTALVAKATVAQAALNVAIDGQGIQFAGDIEGDLTVTQKPNTKITIDGADNTLKGAITIDGKSARYETAGVTIKNLNFDATAITTDASINLGVSGNTNTRYTNHVTVENCTFTDNDYSAVAVKSYTGGDKNLVITGCTATGMHSLVQLANVEEGLVIDGCTANTKNGINLGSSAGVQITNNTINVKGYGVRIGASSGGGSGAVTMTNNTLTTDNTEGDPVIVLRGTAPDQVDLKMSENSVSGTVHISGTTANTKISAEANYWDGKEQPVVAEGSTPVVVNSYYTDAARTTLERNEMGSVNAFVSADRITGDVTHNAVNSLVIQILGADNNIIGTSTLENDTYRDGTKRSLTWRINLGADDSDSWAMNWETGAPSIDNMPAKVKVLVDGVEVGENTIKFTQNGDGQNPVFAAKTDADGKILSFIVSSGFDFSKAAATLVSSAAEGDNIAILKEGIYTVPTGKNLTITGKVADVTFDNIGARNMGGASVTFNNVTFDYYPNVNYTGLQHSGNLVYNNCTINGQVFLYGESETFNECTFNQESSDAYNVWTYGAKEVAFNNCTFNSAGKSVLIYAEGASIFNNVTVTGCTFNASTAVDGKAAIEMDSSLTGGINLTIEGTTATGFGEGNVSGDSLWNNKKGNANNANNDITVTVDGETVLAPEYAAKIGEIGHRTYQEALAAVQAGETITLLADVTTSEVTTINKNIIFDGNGKTLTYTGTDRAFDVPNNETADIDVTIKNLTVVATTANRGLNYNENGKFNVEAVTVTIGENVDGYAINFPGMSDNAQVTIKDSKLTSRNPLNIWGENMTIDVYDSEIISVDNNDQFEYSAIQLNNEIPTVGPNGSIANGTVVNVYGGKLTALNEKGELSNVVANATETGVVNISDETVITGNVVNYVANIGGVYFGSLQAAVNAIEKFGYNSPIVLMKDFATSEPTTIKDGLKVTLNLNGKTINGTDNETKSFGLITINPGAELTINGEGAVTLTATNNRGWNAYSSVISNQRGKLTVNGGTIEHLGGTDMAYAIDNLTNGKSTYAETIINGGTIKSTYRAIRQFLNGTEAQNILTVNAGTIEGANKSIWMQDANKNANSGSLIVADNAVLKGDVYLFVTAGSTEWPVEVSIADAAFEDGSTVITGNIPAQYIVENANGVWGKSNSVASVNGVGYATFAEAIAAIGNGDVVIELLADATFDYNARDAYGTAETTSVTINGNGNTLTLNQKNSDWASIGLANNSKLVLNNMTIEKTGYGDTSGAWNTHAIIFTCPVEMNDVTVNNSIAVQAGATLNNVDIVEANGYYGLWINGNGQAVEVNGGSITATNGGRGIKIADQYVDAPAQVTLSVTGTVFETAQKAAVLVSSKAGANITASNVDITKVAADQVNFVWVDEDWAEYFSEVEVTGATVSVEGADSFAAAITENGAVKGYYKTLAEALTAAADGETVTLIWSEGNDPVAMNGAVFGKTVTITGTATVDWSKGFLFVGRGGVGNGKVIFDEANLTSASDNASYGIHVSGREKDTNDKYDGTVEIKNSTIVLDYLINKGAMTLDNSTLTVKNGISVGGRPASETESGQDATATMALTNGSKLVVNNHNGMGLGYEAIGVMDVDATSTFETTQSFLVTAKGTMNIAGKAVVAGTLTNNGAIVLTDVAATLTSSECGNVTTNVADYKVEYADGAYKLVAKKYVASIDENRKFESFAEALDAVLDGETITLVEGAEGDESKTEIEFTKDIEFTITGKAPKYALPVITFQNATVNIKDAHILIPELDARQNAEINVINSTVDDAGGNSIAKSYYNGAINIDKTSTVYMMQVTTMGYINIEGTLNATWQTNVYGNGMITMTNGATFNTAALQLTGKDYSGRDNTDAERVGMPATIVVDGSNLTVGKVLSNNGADYSYNSSYGINIGTIDGKNAVLDIKNGANVNFFMADGETANIGTGGTVNIDGALSVTCRKEGGNVTLVNNGAINLTAEGATLKAQENLTVTTTLPGYFVQYADGVYSVCGEIVLVDGELTEYTNATDMAIKTLTYKRSNVKTTWTPFYVPFAVPVSALADKFDVAYINDVRRTDSDNNGELDKFSMEVILIHCESKGVDGSSKTLKANYPYFIRSKSGVAEMEITLTDATLYAAKENVYDCTTMTEKFEIKGNYHQIPSDDFDENDYVVGGGVWGNITAGYPLNPFRFYMTRSSRDGSDPTTMAPLKSMKIVVCGEEDENGATIIYDVVEDSLNGDDFIYDLQGRRVSEPKKGGIYIKNGKKILF